MRTSILTVLLAAATGALAFPPPDDKPPEWAKVSPEQVEAAKKLGVPVAFENRIGMRFFLIPPGKFSMGKREEMAAREPTTIEHRVEITKAFYLMHGNVSEWCADWYDEGYYAKSPVQDPQGPASSPTGQRVTRGGNWICWVHECRARSRHCADPKDGRLDGDGFRVAVAVAPK